MTRERAGDPLERDLERWLSGTARPMPPELLHEIIAQVPRARQAGAGGMGRLAGGRRALVPALSLFGVLVLVVGLAALVQRPSDPGVPPSASARTTATVGPPNSIDPGLTWNAYDDYPRATGANPAPDRYGAPGVWGFRFAAPGGDPATAELMPYSDSLDRFAADGFVNLHVYDEGAGLILHPWGGTSDTRSAIVTWTSPVVGEVAIVGAFSLPDRPCGNPADAVTVRIVEGGVSLMDETLEGGQTTFDLRRTVEVGTTVAFVVGPLGNSNCDSTRLVLRISK